VTELSNTTAAVLGMVALGARSGYEIRQAADRSVRFFWALGPPQIYAELKRLEAAGLVTGRDDARGSRPRRLFDVTPEGEAALRAWVARDAAPDPMELRDAELLRLFFADAASPEEALERVRSIRRRSEQALEVFTREIDPVAAATREEGNVFPERVARFGRELHELLVDWSGRLEDELRQPR
jgi:PadR family transcriptional regulator, regulatory protein AphA